MIERSTHSPRKAVFALLFSVALPILVIIRSDAAIEAVSSALSLCAKTVIPSLFPFMVISELIVSLGAAKYIGKLLSPLFRNLFGINGNGASAFILGTLCGFPIGAKAAVSLCTRENISKKELERLLCFCNNPSSAFVISAVGFSLFGSRHFGTALFIITLFSSLAVGILSRAIFGKCCEETNSESISKEDKERTPLGIHTFTGAVTSSAEAMLTVCAFIIFFSALIGTLNAVLEPLHAPNELKALLTGFFELTSGVKEAAALGTSEAALVICAMITGWSGLSVHFQIMAICKAHDISFRPYFAAKAAQGILCSMLMLFYLRVMKPSLEFDESAVSAIFLPIPQTLVYITVAIFAICAAWVLIKKSTKFVRARRKKQ